MKSWHWPMSVNTVWTLNYAFDALNHHDDVCAAFAFDIAVAGGVIFG